MRKQLGSLKGLTVQSATRKRYDKAVDGFLQFLKRLRTFTFPPTSVVLIPWSAITSNIFGLVAKDAAKRVTRLPAYRTLSLAYVTICRQPGGSCVLGSATKSQVGRRPCQNTWFRLWPDGQFLMTTIHSHFHC